MNKIYSKLLFPLMFIGFIIIVFIDWFDKNIIKRKNK